MFVGSNYQTNQCRSVDKCWRKHQVVSTISINNQTTEEWVDDTMTAQLTARCLFSSVPVCLLLLVTGPVRGHVGGEATSCAASFSLCHGFNKTLQVLIHTLYK